MENIAEIVVENIIEDTLPFKSEVTLQSNGTYNRGSGSLSKRAKKKLQKVQNESTNLAQTHATKQLSHMNRTLTDEYNTELCVSALKALGAFMSACGHEIKPTLQRTLQQHIVQLCIETDATTMDKSHLYFSDNCRKSLYEALTSLIMYPHLLSPPPLQYAVKILTTTSFSDPSKEVRKKCRVLMAGIEKIMNPQRTMPYFKVSEEEFNNAIKELRSGKGPEYESKENSDETLDAVINLEDDEPSNVPNITVSEENDTTHEPEVIDLDVMETQDDSCMIVEEDKKQDDEIQEVSETNQEALLPPSNVTTVVLDENPPNKSPVPETDEVSAPPEKRVKLDEEDLVVDELVETFVDE